MTLQGASQAPTGGRVFFSGANRSLMQEDEICLTSVGVDIGSSTAHLLFSEITLERLDTRYIVTERKEIHASRILLTPYCADGSIDAEALGRFVEQQYVEAGLTREDVQTGALILTGVAVRRRNARAIGDLFAAEAGRFVAVSAGDGVETIMAAQGSGALAASEAGDVVVNIDIGGGTTKIAVCSAGRIIAMTAVEVGARLMVCDADDRIIRLEAFGQKHAAAVGLEAALGATLDQVQRRRLAEQMAATVMAVLEGAADSDYLRLDRLPVVAPNTRIMFSGGVSEYIAGRETRKFGDLGPDLAAALHKAILARGHQVGTAAQGIRATVAGASQYTVQVSGSTVFLDPSHVLPLKNVATIVPQMDLSGDVLDRDSIAGAVRQGLTRLDLADGARPVALSISWRGSASYHRLCALSQGLIAGLGPVLQQGHPLIVVSDRDIGGLLGMHCRESEGLDNPIVSIDGIDLAEFDFIDIGEVLAETGAVPVVVKSLIFPSETPDVDARRTDDPA